MNTASVSISVVVLTYNRSDALLRVLDALAAQTDHGFEVIVADDGSRPEHTDVIAAHASRWPFALCHAWHPDRGFTAAAARNMGVRAARGDYVIFLDGDCIPQTDFIAAHRRLAQPGCFVNGSRILLDAPLTSRALQSPLPRPRDAPLWWLRQRLAGRCNKLGGLIVRWPAALRACRRHFRWRGIRSCNLAAWRSDIEAVDGFDQSFDGWGHEDADFVLRLHRAGCARREGFWATEVLHLWHRPAARDDEAANRRKVVDRMAAPDRGCRADMGLGMPPPRNDERVQWLQTRPRWHANAASATADV